MAVLYYGVLARSEKCVCARQSNGAKKRRRNSRKVRQGSLRQSLYYIRKDGRGGKGAAANCKGVA
jgi:hypothetical protein